VVSDGFGEATLEGLPRDGVVLWASLSGWRSAEREASSAGSERLELELKPPGQERELRLRVKGRPEGVSVVAVRAELESGAVCEGRRMRGDDWSLGVCPQGAARVELTTARHGVARVSARLVEATEVVMAAPQLVAFEFLSSSKLSAASVSAQLDGEALEIVSEASGREVAWRAQTSRYPGVYTVRARAEGHREVSRAVQVVEGEEAVHQVVLAQVEGASGHVVDRRGAPVVGAHVEVWRGEQLVWRGASGAGGAFRVEGGRGDELWIFAARAGEGEGAARVRLGGAGERLVVRLSEAPLSIQEGAARVVDVSRLESRLGASLVWDTGGYRVDVTREQSAASRAGIARGAFLIHSRDLGAGRLEVVVCATLVSGCEVVALEQ
jgi:hypothetical protein